MDSPASEDIVFGARVREVVQLDVLLDASLDKAQAVLPEHSVVDGSLADEKLAFEILHVVKKACLSESVRIGGFSVHVTLAVHDLVPLPVDDRTAGHADLECLRMIAPVLGSPVVLDIDDVAFLCHEHLPHPDLSEPGIADHL